MKAFAPVIGAKPSSGALIGVAGNVALSRRSGDDAHFVGRRESDLLDKKADLA